MSLQVSNGRELRRHCLFYLTYLYIRESLPPECAPPILGIQANGDMREARTPASPMSGTDVLALPDKEEMRRFLEAQMAEELGSEAAKNLEDCT
jgi:hypothetical protein